MKRHYLRGPTPYTLGASGNEGDGIKMAQAIGADLRNMNEVWGISVYVGEAEPLAAHRMGATLNAEIEKRAAGSIVVNARGERFHNEAADYDTTWRSYHTWENWGDLGYRNLPAFLLFDGAARERGTIAGLPSDQPLPDWVVSAPSLPELAEKLGIDAGGLSRTVARFNAFAREAPRSRLPSGREQLRPLRPARQDDHPRAARTGAVLWRRDRRRGPRDLRWRPGERERASARPLRRSHSRPLRLRKQRRRGEPGDELRRRRRDDRARDDLRLSRGPRPPAPRSPLSDQTVPSCAHRAAVPERTSCSCDVSLLPC